MNTTWTKLIAEQEKPKNRKEIKIMEELEDFLYDAKSSIEGFIDLLGPGQTQTGDSDTSAWVILQNKGWEILNEIKITLSLLDDYEYELEEDELEEEELENE
ncbi:hypothetical protein ELUMI_v1c04980 [Williamsoniiplasma luminosum]|uniref:Uncharacterized protein n=1 Tax=Williamsoniiplasma luminosum TaxID=214888 RepID=A0A2K8NTQ5_9MOLU|nr:hypothetical protein [Williamsoniiplasma luminosum]ATZ17222.1 hypothetical protein ELUMI_v1c04980 [Williamsoniiplasma luminosum]